MMWKVGEFGQLIGMLTSTLRRWEKEGRLTPERTLGNQRIDTQLFLLKAIWDKEIQGKSQENC